MAKSPDGLQESIFQYQAALRFDPGSAAALNGLGVALARAGRSSDAERCLREALRLAPGDAGAHNNLGNVLAEAGRQSEARTEFRRAIELKPDLAQAHVNLGRALRDTGVGRRRSLNTARRLPWYGCRRGRNSLAGVLLIHGRIGEAIVEYREAVRLDPASAPYRNNLGIALTKAGRIDEAIAQLRAAIERAPDYRDAHYNLGVALQEEGRGDEAEAEFSLSGRPRP